MVNFIYGRGIFQSYTYPFMGQISLILCVVILNSEPCWHNLLIEGLRERTEYIDIFLFSAHHSVVF